MISSVNNANKVRVILERCEMELINRSHKKINPVQKTKKPS